jgi:hypothetical protein
MSEMTRMGVYVRGMAARVMAVFFGEKKRDREEVEAREGRSWSIGRFVRMLCK